MFCYNLDTADLCQSIWEDWEQSFTLTTTTRGAEEISRKQLLVQLLNALHFSAASSANLPFLGTLMQMSPGITLIYKSRDVACDKNRSGIEAGLSADW